MATPATKPRPPAQPADAQLDERFVELHQSMYPRLLAYAMRRLMDHAAAEEVAAEAFVVAWRRRAESIEDETAWLFAIARKLVANQLRAAERRGRLADRMANEWSRQAPDLAAAVADRDELLRALAGLPEGDRELLLLLAWERLDRSQAAAVLGCSRATLAVRLHRARRRLQSEIEIHRGENR